MRNATIQRDTKGRGSAALKIEGRGRYEISTGIRSGSHAEFFAKHGGFRPESCMPSDLDVDSITVEDTGIVLGQLFAKASATVKASTAPAIRAPDGRDAGGRALDLGGRPALVYKDRVKVRLVGDLQTELAEDFFGGFVNHAGANLHAKVLYGRSNHHKLEAIFKCFARAMKYACSKDARLKDQLPSTKGLL